MIDALESIADKTIKKRQAICVIIYITTIIIVFAGCNALENKDIELPESDNIERIELQYSDDSGVLSGTVSLGDEEKDAIRRGVEGG